MRGFCRNFAFFAILGLVHGNCAETEECMPLRFCPRNGEAKLSRDKFCGPAGFLRYCCPSNSNRKTISSAEKKNEKGFSQPFKIKDIEMENQNESEYTETKPRSFDLFDDTFLLGNINSHLEKVEDKSTDGCEEEETCLPLRFCSFRGNEKPNRAKFCGSAGFHRYCCPTKREKVR